MSRSVLNVLQPARLTRLQLFVLMAALSATCINAYAVLPGLPLLEDFKDTALLDTERTNAIWLEKESVVVQAFQSNPWQSTNRTWSISEISGDINNTTAIALGDIDNDGIPDILAANSKDGNRLYLNKGDGNFGAGVSIGSTLHDTACLALGDLNGDGRLDAVFGNVNEVNEVCLNNGQGGFTGGTPVSGDVSNTRAVAVGDVNNDGFPDIVFGNYGTTSRVYINRGDGTFDAGSDITGSQTDTRAIKLGDVNDDGHLDIVTGNWAQRSQVYLNDGKGAFQPGYDITEDACETTAIDLGDINGDGRLDIVAANYARKNRIYLNMGEPLWEGRDLPDEDFLTNDVLLADLDANGAIDVITADTELSFHFFLNDGKASFSETQSPVGEARGAICVAAADLNGDGRIDVAGGNQDAPGLLLLNNGCVMPFLGSRIVALPDSGTDTTALAKGDLNSDGFIDIVAGKMDQKNLYYLNSGSGTFPEGRTLGEGVYKTTSVATGDLNQDGLTDVVAGTMKQKNKVYFNTGGNTWVESDLSDDKLPTTAICIDDMNGDGLLDVLAANVGHESRLFLGAGSGTFRNGIDITDDVFDTFSLAVGDVNKDGHLDVVTGNYGAKSRLYLNTGGIQPFAGVSGSDIGEEVYPTLSVKLGDVNGDGLLDLVTGNHADVNRFYLNNGTPSPFEGVTGESISTEKEKTYNIGLGDLDADHDVDIAVGNSGSQNRIYLNNGTAAPFGGVTGIELEQDTGKTSSLVMADIDDNQTLDIITGFRTGADRLYPNPGRVRRSYGFLSPCESIVLEAQSGVEESINTDVLASIVGFADDKNNPRCQTPHFDLNRNTVESRDVNISGENIVAVRVGLQAVTPPNTAIDFYVTNNGGAQWIKATDGRTVFFPKPGDRLRWKGVFRSRSSVHSAQLKRVTLEIPEFTLSIKTDGTPGAGLQGEVQQHVKAGGNLTPVTAEAPRGFCFSKWVCGDAHHSYENPLTISDIRKDMEVTALFSREIKDFAEFSRIGVDPGYPLDGRYCLQQDIDFSDAEDDYTPVGSQEAPFSGSFFGNSHSISRFHYSSAQGSLEGLFGDVAQGAEIRDLKLTDVNILHNAGYTGALAGRNNGLIENCHVTGRVFYEYYTEVRGALAGENGVTGVIKGCSASVEVRGQGSCIGGLVGRNLGSIEDCQTFGDVMGHQKVGGLAGYQEGGVLIRCSAANRVHAALGEAGGLVGNNIKGVLAECQAAGDVFSQSGTVGGVVGSGWDGELTDCFATGSVTTQNGPAGALVGIQDGGTVNTCYAAGTVSGTESAGLLHFKEDAPPSVTNCYWDRQTTGCEMAMPERAAGEDTPGKTTQEMLKAVTYAGWNINQVGPWSIIEDKTYPYLAHRIPEIRIQSKETRAEDSAVFEVRFSMPVPGFTLEDVAIKCEDVTYVRHAASIASTNRRDLWEVLVEVSGSMGTVSASVNINDVFRSNDAVATIFAGAPTQAAAQPAGVSAVVCSWKDNCSVEDEFLLYFAEGDTLSGEPVAGAPPDSSTHTFEGLPANTNYTFRVSARSGAFISAKSNSASVWTLAHTPLKPVLSDPTLDSIRAAIGSGDMNPSSTEYAVRISANDKNIRWLRTDGNMDEEPEWKSAAAWSNVIITGLTPATEYRVAALARNGAGDATEPGPVEIIHTRCNVNYTAEQNGTVSETPRVVDYGGDGIPVTAKPDPGYRFASWSDGSTENPRQDRNITTNISLEARFERVLGGAGSTDTPYEITNIEELQIISQIPDGRFILKNDIDASATAGWNEGAGFIPVGTDKTPFTGTLDGQGHVISGLVIKRRTENNAGLVGVAGPGGRITGLWLKSVVVEGRDNTGAFVGHNNGASLSRLRGSGTVTGNKNVGGLMGFGERASVEACASDSLVKGDENTGGFGGFNSDCIFNHCYALGSAEGNRNVGGFAGYAYKCGITACYSRCAVKGTWYVGGLLGYNHTGTVRACYAAGAVTGSGFFGGLLGFNDTGTVELSLWDREATQQAASQGSEVSFGLSTAEMQSAAAFLQWDFENTWTLEEGRSYPYLRGFPESPTGTGP